MAGRSSSLVSSSKPRGPLRSLWLSSPIALSYITGSASRNARLAEVSSPLSASKNARKARRSLERAVQIDPQNDEYLRELIDFYLNSPEWFSGGLQRAAALLARSNTQESGAEPRLQQLAYSRKEHSGAGWWIERAILRTSSAIGYFVPQP